jgi:hypothetical protein
MLRAFWTGGKFHPVRMAAALVCIACSASSCSFAPQNIADGVSHSVVDNVAQTGSFIGQNYNKVSPNWDEALAPVSCKDLKSTPPYYSIIVNISANGHVYTDEAISDPAAAGPIGQKFANHIGPGC